MNTVLIAAGIYLSARIISFIAGELTESERKKQEEINATIEQIYAQYHDSDSEERPPEQNIIDEGAIDKKKEIIDFLKNETLLRDAEFETLYNDIRESKRNVAAALKSKEVVQTPLRRSSLELLFRQLSEAQEKCFGYRQYLASYAEELGQSKAADDVPVFLMQLPQMYPYVGKVVWVNADQLSAGTISFEIPGLYSISISVIDKTAYEYGDQNILPLMITGGKRKYYYASLEKGAFKAFELANTHLGLSATVKEIRKDHIILTYLDQLELFLSRDNLIKPDRFPPIRSHLTVYPIKWEYSLTHFTYGDGKERYPATVSERKEDASSSLSFESFPICFSEEDLSAFTKYYNENNLQDYDEEFLIGPVGTKDVILQKGSLLKLQFGDIPLFYIEIDEYSERSDTLRYYFKFHHMCNPTEKTFSADDIFLPFNVSFTPYYAGTSVEMIQHYMEIDDLDDIAALIWDLFEEFRIQDQIRRDREGMGYFFKWESITNQLISVLEQGDSITLKINWIDSDKRNVLIGEIENTNELESFIQHFAQKTDTELKYEWKPQFFVKDEFENRYVATIIDGGKSLRIVGKNVAIILPGDSGCIELYASNRPYAEYQQKTALRQFRIGQVVNPVIQAACMNSSAIVSNFSSGSQMLPLFNDALNNNLSQKDAVDKAFKEKNVFLIQGPPGTGKTTVIRELVEQVLATHSNSRVLIVSQANVAVDNALMGLIEKYGDQTVRCGSGNKISPEFQSLRLQSRCQDYLDELKEREGDFESDFFSGWRDVVLSGESNTYSPALCELIIRSHRLVGATCVGLAKRNIGLERTEFDLVIIDEAGKALPAEMLIPLVRAKKAVIIGDQKQLPPVINPILYDEERIDLEERAVSESDLFCHSFFERLYDNAPDSCKVMLDTQFRMPAVIGTVISDLFYGGKLKNGAGTEYRKPVLFDSNISFIDFNGDRLYRERKDEKNQITNFVEAQAVVSLILNIRKKDSTCTIAVITPYKGQKRLISNCLIKAGIHFRVNHIFVDTIDSFQGSEADVVIFCSTRSQKPTLFFKDSKRINVALSRAKRELIILGRMGYYYRFSRNESCLPTLADYIKRAGNVIKHSECQEIQMIRQGSITKVVLISLEEISLPGSFYMEEYDELAVQKKTEEFYNNGDFLNPIAVKRLPNGYLLIDDFAQFRAAQDLELQECLCEVRV
ncbi:MAG: AAA family ATPase [Acidaminococcaceae bacterium]|nr:AAA family ATPase [Acidaminococcaceae bacterium]